MIYDRRHRQQSMRNCRRSEYHLGRADLYVVGSIIPSKQHPGDKNLYCYEIVSLRRPRTSHEIRCWHWRHYRCDDAGLKSLQVLQRCLRGLQKPVCRGCVPTCSPESNRGSHHREHSQQTPGLSASTLERGLSNGFARP